MDVELFYLTFLGIFLDLEFKENIEEMIGFLKELLVFLEFFSFKGLFLGCWDLVLFFFVMFMCKYLFLCGEDSWFMFEIVFCFFVWLFFNFLLDGIIFIGILISFLDFKLVWFMGNKFFFLEKEMVVGDVVGGNRCCELLCIFFLFSVKEIVVLYGNGFGVVLRLYKILFFVIDDGEWFFKVREGSGVLCGYMLFFFCKFFIVLELRRDFL